MLHLEIPSAELWDEVNNEFIRTKAQKITLEHSLVSISKWESKWMKPFVDEKKTREELLDYIRCMTITQNVSPDIFKYLSDDNIRQIIEYIDSPMTATILPKMNNQSTRREKVTSELIYYWMISWNIPMECQKWHLNRLLTLIQVFIVKNSKPKKMSQRQLMQRNTALNAARKKKYHTRG
jgi:hypothetical protein